MNFEDYVKERLERANLSHKALELVQMGWNGHEEFGEAPASGEVEPVAWLVTNSRLWKDRAFISKLCAEQCVAERNDSSGVIPLFTHPPAKVPNKIESDGLKDPVNLAYCDGWNDCRKEMLNPPAEGAE